MKAPLLTQVLQSPKAAADLPAAQWDLLVRQARHANLLGRLHHLLQAADVDVPQRPWRHLQSAATVAARQHLSVRWEVQKLRDVLAPLGVPLILLKGAAYVTSGLPAATGRVFADIDILLPRDRLDEAESLLMLNGWNGENLDAYDQRYYRRWMHELPPMQHIFRGTALDVHHTVLPPTSRGAHIDSTALQEDSVELPGCPGVRVLAPTDMVLHSAAHLFHEGEPDNLLRDLSDLDLLLRHFGTQPGFWPALTARAHRHGLSRALRLALRYCHAELNTPIPRAVLHDTGADVSLSLHDRLLDAIYQRVLRPMHASTADRWTAWCCRLLYIRSHWLRMPALLLAYHLLHKALVPPKTETAGNAPR